MNELDEYPVRVENKGDLPVFTQLARREEKRGPFFAQVRGLFLQIINTKSQMVNARHLSGWGLNLREVPLLDFDPDRVVPDEIELLVQGRDHLQQLQAQDIGVKVQ
ncbi:MAG: hypothetical protein NTY64_05630 [Deltaproteobacteria bacterium]|nr:hypothetical protein [Deltaproteobacteria bacterium]